MSTESVGPYASPSPGRRREAHWNVGLDFGTAFTKCVVRRNNLDAFIVPFETNDGLLPSEVLVTGTSIWLPGDTPKEAAPKRILHLKMALAEATCSELGDSWVQEFRRQTGASNDEKTAAVVENLTAYFLARAISKARDFIRQHTPNFGEVQGDRLSANMAIPIAHEEEIAVEAAFQRCLRKAWLLKDAPRFQDLTYSAIESILEQQHERLHADLGCYIYPEVSANVQSYIKSRAGTDGLYLFVDIGAGTVDLSAFVYYTEQSNEKPISYLAAGVLPLGASQIEMRASARATQHTLGVLEAAGVPSPDAAVLQSGLQELLRQAKERLKRIDHALYAEIESARRSIESELFENGAKTLNSARLKLVQDAEGRNRAEGHRQWRTLKLLVGGGGAGEALYRRGVNKWFNKTCQFSPPQAQIPVPTDLTWPVTIPSASQATGFRRFAVAYGLSFDRATLEDHRFPKDVRRIHRQPVPPPQAQLAPSKEDC